MAIVLQPEMLEWNQSSVLPVKCLKDPSDSLVHLHSVPGDLCNNLVRSEFSCFDLRYSSHVFQSLEESEDPG